MKHYIITGTSSGIGRALCEELFQFDDVRIYGYARRDGPFNKNYQHTIIDLSDLKKTSALDLPVIGNNEDVFLINNAGTLGEVAKAGDLSNGGIIQGFNVNLISVAILTNKFIDTYKDHKGKKVILNISSGAGKSPIDGWSVYCATKAGLDMFSKVIAEEQKINGQGFRIFSVAPGIVDTEMQAEIRSSDKEDFSRINDFIRYKNEGELADPLLVSRKIISILDNSENFNETVFSVRDL